MEMESGMFSSVLKEEALFAFVGGLGAGLGASIVLVTAFAMLIAF